MSERTKFRLRIFFGILCVFIVERLWTLLTHREESRSFTLLSTVGNAFSGNSNEKFRDLSVNDIRQPAKRTFQEYSNSFLRSFKYEQSNDIPSTIDIRNNLNLSQITRDICYQKYGSKSFLADSKKKLPPMFYTFPGSGNTWGRLLIEHATGIFTGSVYNDRTLIDTLPGEFTCDRRVSVIKVHPHTHSFSELDSGHFASDDHKCEKGNVRRFERAILLIRNPFDSIWSEYQRRITQSHVQGIMRRGFDWPRWQANAAHLSIRYHEMITRHYAGIERKFPPQNVLYIKYELLKNKSTRITELKKITEFLGFPASEEKLHCAFLLSESTQALRSLDESDMTKELAYTRPLTCRMWNLFGSHIIRFNYSVFNGYDCTNIPPVKEVAVGAQGEYDSKWVQPGQPLLDFGGHDDFDKQYGTNQQNSLGQTKRGGKTKGSRKPGSGLKIKNPVSSTPVSSSEFIITDLDCNTEDTNVAIVKRSNRMGMTFEEAQSIPGLGRVGEHKPIWS